VTNSLFLVGFFQHISGIHGWPPLTELYAVVRFVLVNSLMMLRHFEKSERDCWRRMELEIRREKRDCIELEAAWLRTQLMECKHGSQNRDCLDCSFDIHAQSSWNSHREVQQQW